MNKRFTFLVALFAISQSLFAQSLRIDDVDPKEVKFDAFTLNRDAEVVINGTGGIFRDDYKLLIYYGWILDANTRKVVWHAYDRMEKRRDYNDSEGMVDFKDELKLPAGDYELYFTGSYGNHNWGDRWVVNSFNDLVEEIFDARDREKFRRTLQEDLFIQVSAGGLSRSDASKFLDRKTKEAFVYFLQAGNNVRYEEGFTLADETDIRLYAIGEGQRDEVYDYFWIYEAATRERVFEMDYRNTAFAGGAEKNLKVDEEITLPAGSYVLSYRSDDSHSYDRWNALPPDDPQFWGVALFPATEADRENLRAYSPPKTAKPVIELTRIRNNELTSTGFSLNDDLKVRVLCLGERDSDDEMADYGWIVEANTRDVVWKMKGWKSEHAGGASKNRRIDEVIDLPKGDYIAYYKSDGSHAYNSWNSSSPHEEELWGMTVWAVNESDMNKFEKFNAEDFSSKNLLTEIVMVGDNDYLRESFVLKKPTRITVVALGEGSNGDMYDYGWIRNMDTGRIEWEMDYYETKSAGGAKKNRMVSETITLEPGEYRLYYETDGSHSFSRWNDDPPNDPQSYGIRLLLSE